MEQNEKREELITALTQMEKNILEERHLRKKEGRSSFSYWLYATKIKEYAQHEGRQNTEEQLRKRLEEVIEQHQINIENNPWDEELRSRSLRAIEEARKWLEYLCADMNSRYTEMS